WSPEAPIITLRPDSGQNRGAPPVKRSRKRWLASPNDTPCRNPLLRPVLRAVRPATSATVASECEPGRADGFSYIAYNGRWSMSSASDPTTAPAKKSRGRFGSMRESKQSVVRPDPPVNEQDDADGQGRQPSAPRHASSSRQLP